MGNCSREAHPGSRGSLDRAGRWCIVLNKTNWPVYPAQLRPHKLRWRSGTTTTTKWKKKKKKSFISRSRPGGKKTLIHFLFPQLNFRIKLLVAASAPPARPQFLCWSIYLSLMSLTVPHTLCLLLHLARTTAKCIISLPLESMPLIKSLLWKWPRRALRKTLTNTQYQL